MNKKEKEEFCFNYRTMSIKELKGIYDMTTRKITQTAKNLGVYQDKRRFNSRKMFNKKEIELIISNKSMSNKALSKLIDYSEETISKNKQELIKKGII